MSSRGFSLLEALVTLVIVSLVATVLMQSLLHVLGMRERMLRADREGRTAVLHERWFRDSAAAAIGDRPDGAMPFAGDASGLRFLSHAPLEGQGVLAVSWRLVQAPDGRFALEYEQSGRRWPVLPPALEGAAFDYLDSRGTWHAGWPLESAPDAALPRAVRLAATRDGKPLVWWVAVAAGPGLPPTLRFLEEMPGADL